MSVTWLLMPPLSFWLMSPLDRWQIVEYAASAVVIVGVLGEYLAEFHVLKDNEERRRTVAKLSTLVLLAGLAVELLGLVRTSQLSEITIARLNDEAEDARNLAAQAQQSAEQEHLERDKLEQKLADRHVTVEQRKKMLVLLRSRPGTKVTVDAVISEGRDAVPYAREMADVFHDAKWDVEYPWRLITMDKPQRGLLIEIQHDSASNRGLASLIEKALFALGTSVSKLPIRDDPNLKSDLIILVGGK